MTYVNKKGERSTMPLNQALDSNNAEMTKRLKYTKDILTHMLNNNQQQHPVTGARQASAQGLENIGTSQQSTGAGSGQMLQLNSNSSRRAVGAGAPAGPGVPASGMQLPPGVDAVPSVGMTSISGSQPSSAGFQAMSSIAHRSEKYQLEIEGPWVNKCNNKFSNPDSKMRDSFIGEVCSKANN